MDKTIGVVGGMGTYAGIDLLEKIADNSGAETDQDHLPLIMISLPHMIKDRSEFLFREVEINPGKAISDIVTSLSAAGAELIALPCNTAHVPEILSIVEKSLPEGVTLVNMIKEVTEYICQNFSGAKKVGILGTNGVYKSKVYSMMLEERNYKVVYPDKEMQFNMLHGSIYDPEYGIKAQSKPVSQKAKDDIYSVAAKLIDRGAELLILACTEIPLAINEKEIDGIPLIDAAEVLARALVRESRGS